MTFSLCIQAEDGAKQPAALTSLGQGLSEEEAEQALADHARLKTHHYAKLG